MRTVIALGLVLALLVGCAAPGSGVTPTAAVPGVALLLARGGLGDKAFNDSAYTGLQKAEQAMAMRIKAVEFQEGDAQIAQARELALGGYTLIIALGAENVPAIKTVAAEFPQQKFAVVDTTVDAPNVASVIFSELEGDFLAGALTALLSPSGKVGFLGGADILVIRRIEYGWRQGVLYVNPQAEILSEYAGGKDDFSAFTKPEVGQALTEQMYTAGAEVVYAAAGKTGLGAITAAQAQKRLIITTGSDQRWIAPDAVVTSRIKDMYFVVFSLAREAQAGTLKLGVRTLDYHTGGIGLAPLDGWLVPADVSARFEVIRGELDAGKITVPPYVAP